MGCAYVSAVQFVDGDVLPAQFRYQELDRDLLWEVLGRTMCTQLDGLDNKWAQRAIGYIQVLQAMSNARYPLEKSANIKYERFGVALLGNPGTVARLYAKFLASLGVLPGTTVKETTGARLASDGVQACKELIEEVFNADSGAIFIDEAYQLASGTNYSGGQVLDFLLAEVENLTGKVVFILAGYNKQMERFFAHNPGLPNRFPHEIQFKDYEDEELRQIFEYQIKKWFQGCMIVEDGLSGLYCRIVARRVGYACGRERFGNARAVENAFTREKLKGLTGLKAVKLSIKALFDSLQYNYQRELEEKPLLQFNLNRVFLGSSGIGKTTVAKLYGQVLADLGLLSNGEIVVKNPSDFVGDVSGASEKTTKGILTSTVGKVLVIDEAYSLYGGSGIGSGPKGDPYKTAVIDTIVAEIQSIPGDDRCVLLIGYRDQMEAMFQNANPGLSRRFPLSEAFEFEDFTDDELKEILDMKLEQQAYKATDHAKRVAMEVLKRARNRPNFRNAGECQSPASAASLYEVKDAATLEAVNIDPEFDRGEGAAPHLRMLFEGVVGCDELVAQLEGYQQTVANMKARDMDSREQIPFNVLFRGPPGKCKIYYDMRFLATAEVLEIFATDLVGEYVGHTGPKTQRLLEKALGKVLFIDEAYRFAEGQFAKEAMDEIVNCLTKPGFAQRLVVILAGYDADINRLMSTNPSLSSRFPETVTFRSLNPQECLKLFTTLLRKEKYLDIAPVESPSAAFQQELLRRFENLTSLANWANARDVGVLAKAVFGQILRIADPTSPDLMRLDEITVLTALDAMITERSNRAKDLVTNLLVYHHLPMQTVPPRTQNVSPPPNLGTEICQASSQIGEPPPKEPPQEQQAPATPSADPRDSGVIDEVWTRLQLDKQAATAHEKDYYDLLADQAELEAEHARQQEEEEEEERQGQQQQRQEEEELLRRRIAGEAEAARLAAEEAEGKHPFEQERLRRELERRHEEELARLTQERVRVEEKRKEEATQRRLRTLGICVAGFRWIKQVGGYRRI
ncbi:MAG: hypothetical protein M1816_001416 [Peltula sp. TS41687]|nr:MAG: hypothetical protein M1816_001416 [Peltula sp. TS41687]